MSEKDRAEKSETHAGAFVHKRIRVLIVDDSAAFRRAMARFLDRLPQVEVVGVAGDGAHGLALAMSTRPDLALMDMKMPRLNGLATRKIRAQLPDVRVILITLHDSEEFMAESAAARVDGSILKFSLRQELPGALAQLFPGRAGGPEQRP